MSLLVIRTLFGWVSHSDEFIEALERRTEGATLSRVKAL